MLNAGYPFTIVVVLILHSDGKMGTLPPPPIKIYQSAGVGRAVLEVALQRGVQWGRVRDEVSMLHGDPWTPAGESKSLGW